MIDFHCHIDLYDSPRDVVAGVVARAVYVLAVTTTPLAWEGTTAVLDGADGVRVAVGLHPELVASRSQEVDRLCELIPQTDYVGEIGLDGSRAHRASLPEQERVLDQVLRACAAAGGRILSVHSRGAPQQVLDQLGDNPGAGTAVLHWFSGSEAQLARAAEQGCWFSVGPAMFRSARGRSLVNKMPRDRVLTESDGPFVRIDGSPAMPWDVALAENALAVAWELPVEATRVRLLENLRTLVATESRS